VPLWPAIWHHNVKTYGGVEVQVWASLSLAPRGSDDMKMFWCNCRGTIRLNVVSFLDIKSFAKFEVLNAAIMTLAVFWVFAP
jgi:hypothetical protein